jgi:hypothetical protein
MSKREFYKATRPDGTDFATGTVKYELAPEHFDTLTKVWRDAGLPL